MQANVRGGGVKQNNLNKTTAKMPETHPLCFPFTTVMQNRDMLVRIRMRIREAQKHTDPADPDPDPEHWYIDIILQR